MPFHKPLPGLQSAYYSNPGYDCKISVAIEFFFKDYGHLFSMLYT